MVLRYQLTLSGLKKIAYNYISIAKFYSLGRETLISIS